MTTKTDKQLEREQRMYDALKLIGSYMTPRQIRRDVGNSALDYEEYLEMAYENIREDAKRAIRGMKRPAVEQPGTQDREDAV